MNTKKCTKCGEEKLETEEFFYFRKDTNKYRNKCKICLCQKSNNYYDNHKTLSDFLKKRKEYRDNNKESIKINKKQYYIEHKEILKQKSKEHRESNLQYYKEYNKKYRSKKENKYKKNRRKKEKSKIDLNFHLEINIRGRIYQALKRNSKSKRTLELLGCSIIELKKHLESQFTSGMSWDNYGLWHIDHKLPCASFDLSKPIEQRKCFNFKNLQPLWAIDNLRKSDKILKDID